MDICECGCGQKVKRGKRFIHGHYQRGRLSPNHGLRIPIEDRFWPKVNKDGPVMRLGLTPCWNWTGALCSDGYGNFWDGRCIVSAHRIAWQLAGNELPKDADICHKCDNPNCVNPAHLFLGTAKINAMDMASKWRCNHKGERNGGAKLNLNQVREIINSLNNGERVVELTRKYNVSIGPIYRIRKGQAWEEITRSLMQLKGERIKNTNESSLH